MASETVPHGFDTAVSRAKIYPHRPHLHVSTAEGAQSLGDPIRLHEPQRSETQQIHHGVL